MAILDQVASIGIETVKLLNHDLVKAWYWFWSSHELLSWLSIGHCHSLGQVLVFAFVLVKFSAFSTLHKPHHLSLQLSVPSRVAIFKFFLFLAPLINAKKWQKSKALPQREVHRT